MQKLELDVAGRSMIVGLIAVSGGNGGLGNIKLPVPGYVTISPTVHADRSLRVPVLESQSYVKCKSPFPKSATAV
jgi:hypothetical protein